MLHCNPLIMCSSQSTSIHARTHAGTHAHAHAHAHAHSHSHAHARVRARARARASTHTFHILRSYYLLLTLTFHLRNDDRADAYILDHRHPVSAATQPIIVRLVDLAGTANLVLVIIRLPVLTAHCNRRP